MKSGGRLIHSAALVLGMGLGLCALAPVQAAIAQEITATVRSDTVPREARRERLFRFLSQARTEAEGRSAEFAIWNFWLEAPDNETARLMNEALEHRRRYDFAGALRVLDDLVERTPDWAEAWNQRATILFELGEDERALDDVHRVLTFEPWHFGAMAGQAIILMRQGRFQTAQSVLRRAVEVHPFLAERSMLVPGPGEIAPQPGERRL